MVRTRQSPGLRAPAFRASWARAKPRRGAVRTSSRGEVDPFIVMDVMEAARRRGGGGPLVIHMEVGQPGTPAPAAARAALARAMEAGPLGYTVALGLPALRARIARLYARLVRGRPRSGAGGGDRRVVGRLHPRLHQPLRPRRPGGDRRAGLSELPPHPARARPGAGGHRHRARAPVPAGARGAGGGPRRACWWRARPIRPGRCSTAPALAALIGAAAERGIAFVSDEIYHGIQYGGARRSRRWRSATRSTSSTRSRSTSR